MLLSRITEPSAAGKRPAFQSQDVGGQAGVSMIEMMIVLVILVTVSGIVSAGLFQMTMTQGTVWNRTEMHSAVRGATELLQQEIGQAGSIALPASGVTLTGAALGNATSQPVGVTSSTGMFPGMQLVIGPDNVSGCVPTVTDKCGSQETVTLTNCSPLVGGACVGPGTITAIFQDPHANGAAVSVAGAFASGIVSPCGPIPVPPCPAASNKILSVSSAGAIVVTTLTATNGSTGNKLKLFGDINGDGNLVYVEYACDMTTNPGRFTRSVTPFTAGAKTAAQTLLANVLANPGGTACFDYQRKPSAPAPTENNTYVINVTVTLTVQTETRDPKTKQFLTETKALLNVSPRNVYQAYLLSGGGMTNRIQPMPYSVTQLLP